MMRCTAPSRAAAASASAHQTRAVAVVLFRRGAGVARAAPSAPARRGRSAPTTTAALFGGGAAAASAKAAAAAKASPVLLPPDVAFTAATFAVVALYALAVAAPFSRPSKAIFLDRPALAPSLLGLAYLLLAWQAHRSGALPALLDAARRCFPAPDPLALAAVFRDATLTAMAWLHLLAVDLVSASAVMRDALATGTPVRHSVALCLMFGPLGLLSHAVTRWAVAWWRGGRADKGPGGRGGAMRSPSPLV